MSNNLDVVIIWVIDKFLLGARRFILNLFLWNDVRQEQWQKSSELPGVTLFRERIYSLATPHGFVENAWMMIRCSRGQTFSLRLARGARTLVFGTSAIFMSIAGIDAQTSLTDLGHTWQQTDSLVTARYFHTATLLGSGKVLAAGGSTPSGQPTASVELFDPASGKWGATGRMSAVRTQHTALLLPDGKVLVACGTSTNFNPTATAEVYNPITGMWSDTGSLKGFPGNSLGARIYHSMTLLGNGKVLVAGGEYSSSAVFANTQLYDPSTGIWNQTGDLGAARYYHTATLLGSGKVLVAGGYNNGYLASAELYDPTTGMWTATGSMNNARGEGHTAILLPDGKVLVAGGYNDVGYLRTAELYDPVTGIWSLTGKLNVARDYHAATLLSNGLVLVAGGFKSTPLDSAELYNPATGIWQLTGSVGLGRFWHTLTAQPNGTVLFAGGGRTGGAVVPANARSDLYTIDQGVRFAITFGAPIGSSAAVDESPDLQSWSVAIPTFTTNSSVVSVNVSASIPATRHYWRVRIEDGGREKEVPGFSSGASPFE